MAFGFFICCTPTEIKHLPESSRWLTPQNNPSVGIDPVRAYSLKNYIFNGATRQKTRFGQIGGKIISNGVDCQEISG